MADIVTGLTALKTAFDLAKDIKNATGAYNDAEMRLKFSELYSALSEAKIELADTQLEMYELKLKSKSCKLSLMHRTSLNIGKTYTGGPHLSMANQTVLFAQDVMKVQRRSYLQ